METLRREPHDEARYAEIRRGWRSGAEEFVARMLDQMETGGGEKSNRA
jgi:hypothetical protein